MEKSNMYYKLLSNYFLNNILKNDNRKNVSTKYWL